MSRIVKGPGGSAPGSVTLRARFVGRSIATRSIVTGRKCTFTGLFPSAKTRRQIAYESLDERNLICLMENDPDVDGYDEQPPALPWSDGEQAHLYHPDLLVRRSGKRILAEAKPASVVEEHNLLPVYGMIRAFAKAAGFDDLELWTDRNMAALDIANAELLAGERSAYCNEEALFVMRETVRRAGGAGRIRDLRASSGLGHQAFRAVVRLLAMGELESADPRAPIDDHLQVRAAQPRCWPEQTP